MYRITEQTEIATIGGLLGGFLSAVFGGLDQLIWTLIFMTACDYVSGTMLAWKRGQITSQKAQEGINRKVVMFMMVGGGHLVDSTLLKDSHILRDGVTTAYIIKEWFSLTENAGLLGVWVPGIVKKGIALLNDEVLQTEKKEGNQHEL